MRMPFFTTNDFESSPKTLPSPVIRTPEACASRPVVVCVIPFPTTLPTFCVAAVLIPLWDSVSTHNVA